MCSLNLLMSFLEQLQFIMTLKMGGGGTSKQTRQENKCE